jgi:hypothetical protein
MLLLEAFAHQEGFYSAKIPINRPRRNNNPLDLEYGLEAISFGAIKGDPRFAIFKDISSGWYAAKLWLSVPARFVRLNPNDGRPPSFNGYLVGGYLGATMEQVVYRFAPPNENDTNAYLNYICSAVGVSTTTVLVSKLLQLPE